MFAKPLIAAALAMACSAAIAAGEAPPAGGATAPAPPAQPVEKVICKSRPVTGSLVSRQRTCLTRSQWKYTNEQNETSARRMVEENTSRPLSN